MLQAHGNGEGEGEGEEEKRAEGTPKAEDLPGGDTEHGAALQRAHNAFMAGDYAVVRELTKSLEKAPDDVALAAAHLRRRVSVDPAQIAVLGACVLFFFFIVWKYVL